MLEYTEYHPFTLTGRPSNHFNNINYAALTYEQRKRFIPRHDFLIEIDLKSFHLQLIYYILGFPIPDDIYNSLSKLYPPDVDPKDYTFKMIYGGIPLDLSGVEPFKSIDELSRSVYFDFKNGALKTFLFKRPIKQEFYPDHTRMKIFNYMLQNLETEFNSLLIKEMNELLDKKETKLILYTYDSFLFDFSKIDGIDLIKEITNIFDNLKFRLKVGTNYSELREC